MYHTGDHSISLPARHDSSSAYGTATRDTSDRTTGISPVLAATRIQAGYRGYRVRKELHHEFQDDLSNQSRIYPQYPAKSRGSTEADKAAAKIQASFRGYMTRRALLEQKLSTAPRREMHKQNERNQQGTNHSDRIPVSTVTPLRTRDSNLYSFSQESQSISCVPSNIRDFSDHYQSAPQNRAHKDLNEAAAIIQAGFRGYQTRKALHHLQYAIATNPTSNQALIQNTTNSTTVPRKISIRKTPNNKQLRAYRPPIEGL
ncbi:hypothetical protein AHF37_08601 [Paragonimus kellicotti]|nr:hypothetical protein AHF37_08601 [Paragonimus kellicotti]